MVCGAPGDTMNPFLHGKRLVTLLAPHRGYYMVAVWLLCACAAARTQCARSGAAKKCGNALQLAQLLERDKETLQGQPYLRPLR